MTYQINRNFIIHVYGLQPLQGSMIGQQSELLWHLHPDTLHSKGYIKQLLVTSYVLLLSYSGGVVVVTHWLTGDSDSSSLMH